MLFIPKDSDFDHKVHDHFNQQKFMVFIGAKLYKIEP